MMISFQLPELIARATRQKASADAMLNTAITQQLEGVSRGLESLQESLDTVQHVHTQYEALQHGLADVPGLVGRLHDIQEENKRLALMMEEYHEEKRSNEQRMEQMGTEVR